MEEEKQEIITKEEAEKLMDEDANICTKNFRIGLGAIALLSTLAACGIGIIVVKNINRPKNSFTYKIDHDGKIQVSGRVKFKEVKNNWYLLEKQLNDGKSRLYIVDQRFSGNLINVSTDVMIANSVPHHGDFMDETILNLEKLEPYLVTYDMVYGSYTIEDIDRLLGLIEVDYEYVIPDESNKVMMKTNEQTIEQTIN